MINPFSTANSLRYSEDVKLKDVEFDNASSNLTLSWVATSGLKVSEDITPELYFRLKKVCKKFNLPIGKVEAYVVSDPNINAWCYRTGKNSCLIVFHSEIINLLTFDEIEFIIGHELGHFLLDHHFSIGRDEDKTNEDFMLQRAQEISADRIGLWACEDLDIAMQTVIKMISGLNSSFLRFDVNAFLSQVKDRKITHKHLEKSTHPSFVLRAEALMRFSASKNFLELHNKSGGSSLEGVDRLIKKDLQKYVSGYGRIRNTDVKDQFMLWSIIYHCIKDGDLTKDEQKIIVDLFGRDKKSKLIKMIKNKSRKEVVSIGRQKLREAARIFREANPISSWFKIRSILSELENKTGFDGFSDSVQEVI